MIDFKQNLFQDTYNQEKELTSFLETKALAAKTTIKELAAKMIDLGDIMTSDQISGIEIRLANVVIKDNHTPKVFPFPGLANIYVVTIVVSDLDAVALPLTINGFEKVQDGDSLGSIDRTLYYWQKDDTHTQSPSQIHVMCSVVKSKQGLRNIAEIMKEINNDNDYKNLFIQLSKALKNSTPVTNLISQVASIVGKYLGKVEDKPLYTVLQSFTTLNSNFDKQGTTPFHYENKYISMYLDLTVRDAARQKEFTNAQNS